MAFVSTGAFGVNKALRVSKSTSRQVRSVVRMGEKSQSLPFLEKPKACDGTLGTADVGFDPLYISDLIDIKWLRESELKHGRICMLASLGFIVQEFIHLPGPEFQNKLATEAVYQVPTAGLWQIFLFCGLVEFISNRGRLTYADMFADPKREPGNFGFDPLGLGKNEAMRKKYQANEIANGRLAMLAVGGFIHQMFVFKQPVVDQLFHMRPMSY
eukprot:Plantae.Rhodophyta-Purpureofilum_apyrenoidigerum.ctg373.p2 GENE.Plantae.Rhodophyta-Purpureofilum_apyrenoidigerum.ctg373~~Plantae.Rhodophyta-Purpureofilum_apyrenoidigerum.ctg373.p2  ORF type:complete len:226 (-),score=38.49 Plantae.Rhodophyta-Purpureofilum_apyrenoidigerum.ctg373:139-780(-)